MRFSVTLGCSFIPKLILSTLLTCPLVRTRAAFDHHVLQHSIQIFISVSARHVRIHHGPSIVVFSLISLVLAILLPILFHGPTMFHNLLSWLLYRFRFHYRLDFLDIVIFYLIGASLGASDWRGCSDRNWGWTRSFGRRGSRRLLEWTGRSCL